MKYVLVQDKQYVLLGPIEWRPRMIQSEIDDLDIPWRVPVVEQGYISITDHYEIFPVVSIIEPNYQTDFEELSGPFYTFNNNEATATYIPVNLSIEQIQSNLKSKVSAERYRREIAGTTVNINGVDYNIETDRNNRPKWVHLATLTGPTNWKFNNEFVSLTNQDANLILNSINSHVQNQFDWEKNMFNEIDRKTSIEELKLIVVPNSSIRINI